jgi:sugar/nucleoside kinase (ribokinase family)
MFYAYDVISIGDMGIDVFLGLDKKELEIRHNKSEQKICFNYADKIPVETMQKTIAGNACNVAVGARRLGLKSALVTHIGKDEEAKMVARELIKERIDTRFVKQDKRTNFSAVLNYNGERSIFVYHEPRDYVLPRLPKAKFVYLTSMKSGWENIIDPLCEYLDKTGTKLAFNPGTYQLRAGIKIAQKLLDHCEVIFLNVQEALLYTNKPDKTKISDLLTAVHRHGPRVVVITDGPRGSYASDGTGQYFLGIYDAPVVERTGCGDAYGTGFTAALCNGKDAVEAMRWGSFESASVLQQVGPQAGLLTPKEFELTQRKYPDFNAKELAKYKDK